MLKEYFADLHIHVGITENGQWVKIPSSRHLTVKGILSHAAKKKGIDIIGIADAMSPAVLADLSRMRDEGFLSLDPQGGYHYKEKGDDKTITLLLGAEIETSEENGAQAHTLVYLPDISGMAAFSREMSKYIKNINLSSQNAHMPLKRLVEIAEGFGALIIPAHIFTPHKSVYGSCTRRLAAILPPQALQAISAVELGLSADSMMADRIDELTEISFLTNSDAHSLEKIGREYNIFSLVDGANFTEISLALARREGRMVKANYGLDPRLGKYHRTVCLSCGEIIAAKIEGKNCPLCQSSQIVKGVLNRVDEIADRPLAAHPAHRSEYFYQIPLEFIAGLGKKTLAKLMEKFNTEMNILHFAHYDDLTAAAGAKIANNIMDARSGNVRVLEGGGGIYGKIV